MIAMSLLSLLLASTALAAPTRRYNTFQGACSVPASAVSIPSQLNPPQSPPNLVQMGVGVQNYTCNSNGTYDSVGVVARMFDMSCSYGTPAFSALPNDTFDDWNAIPSYDPMDPTLVQVMQNQHGIPLVGEYYFIKQNGTLYPEWDSRSTGPFTGNPDAFVIAQKVQGIPSPDGPENVDWVGLKKLSGGLANQIIRVETVKGQPPSTCTPGCNTSVKYTAKYYFY